MTRRPTDPAEHLADSQDELYDLVVTRLARPPARHDLRRLRRDAQEAAALAEGIADLALGLAQRERRPRSGG